MTGNNLEMHKITNKISNIKIQYSLIIIIILISLDKYGKLLYLTFSLFYPCLSTYQCLIKGGNYLQWTYFWLLILSLRLIELLLENTLLNMTFQCYYYVKLIGSSYLYRRIELAEIFFKSYSKEINNTLKTIESFQDSGLNFYIYMKKIKTLNKQYFN